MPDFSGIGAWHGYRTRKAVDRTGSGIEAQLFRLNQQVDRIVQLLEYQVQQDYVRRTEESERHARTM